MNRSHGLLEREKGLKERFSTHCRGLEIEELLELMEDMRIRENRMWRFQWYERNTHLAIGETERGRERSGRKKKKARIWRRGGEREEIDSGTNKYHSVPLETSSEGSLLFIYVFIFWRTPKQQEISSTLKAARKSATGPVRKQAFMIAGDIEYSLLGRLGAASSSMSLRHGNRAMEKGQDQNQMYWSSALDKTFSNVFSFSK